MCYVIDATKYITTVITLINLVRHLRKIKLPVMEGWGLCQPRQRGNACFEIHDPKPYALPKNHLAMMVFACTEHAPNNYFHGRWRRLG